MKINLKKILVSLMVIIGFVFYAAYQRYFIGQLAPVTNTPPPDTVAANSPPDTAPSTTVNQTTETLPSTDSTQPLADNSIRNNSENDGENDDEDGGFIPQQPTTSTLPNQTGTGSSSSTSTTSGVSSSTTNTTSAATTNTTSAATGLYKDGQYDGNAADAYYGLVQVRAIIQGGQLTDVVFLRYPSDRSYSVEINTYAMPILKAEAIKNQSAKVNVVTGATNSTRAFVNSLSNALSQAQV